MTLETMVLTEPDPYEGLRELAIKCLRALRRRLETFRPWEKFKPIRGGGPGVFDDIANFLNNLLSFLRPWDLFQWLRWRVFDPLMGFLQGNILNPLLSHLWALKDSFLGWWGGAVTQLRSAIASIPSVLWNAIVNLPGTLGNIFRGIFDAVKATLSYDLWLLRTIWERVPASIREPIENFALRIWQRIQTLWEVFGGYFNTLRAGVGTALANLSAFLHNPIEGLRAIWERFQQSWAGQLLTSFLGGLSTFWNTIITALREWWATLQPKLIQAAESAITFARPYIERWVGAFQELPAIYLNWAAGTAGTDLALHPSTALATAGSLYAMSIAAGSLAMMTSTALNLIPATNWVGASQFSAFIAEAAGFEPLTRATYGVLLNDVLTQPLRYHWNMQLRPRIPTEGTIFLMGRKRGLNRGEFTQAMGYQGIPNWWIDKEYLFFWTDPSPYWLLRMSEAANPEIKPSGLFLPWLEEWLPNWRGDPWAWYKMKLMLAGFEDTDIPAFIEGFQKRMVSSAVTQVKTSVRAMLRDDYWTKVDAEGALRPMGTRQEEIELMYIAERLDYQHEYLDDQVMYYKERFRKGEIDEQDLTLALSTIYTSPERVAQEVARERVRALPKPKAITEPKEDPLVVSLRRQAVNSWTKAYRDWKIDAEDLLLGLVIVLQGRDLATQLVETEMTRYREPPVVPVAPPEAPEVAKARRQAIASWVTAFRDGEISRDQLELYLEPLILDREIRLQVVELESLRYRPTPDLIPPPSEDPELAKIRQEYVRGHIEEFQKRLIGLEQLYAFLLADGLVEELARATVITQANKRIKVPALDSPYFLQDVIRDLVDQGLLAYEEMYMRAQITIDQYAAWLTSLTVDPDVVTYLADTLTLRRFLEGL